MLLREGQFMNSFKPGDWVQHIELATTYGGHILKIEEIDERNEQLGFVSLIGQGKTLHSNFAELWKPKLNEWCWFWNRDKPNKTKLKQLYSINYEHDVHWTYKTIDCKTYQHCEPFIGQLPTNLKDLS